MPFERSMLRIKRELEKNVYSMKLLEDFYLPIFQNKLVDTLFFLPDWQTSRGATWEHEQGKNNGIEVVYLPEDLFTDEVGS
jgi:hypothetical protein